MTWWVYDTEANGFYPYLDKMWCIVLQDFNDKKEEQISIRPFEDKDAREKFLSLIKDGDVIAAHNQGGFDIWALSKILGFTVTFGPDTIDGKKVQFLDTYYLSQFLNPDRGEHSIDYFGRVLGNHKIDWREKAIELGLIEEDSPDGEEFKQWHPEMEEYCKQDVKVNVGALKLLMQEWEKMYSCIEVDSEFKFTNAFKMGQKAFFLQCAQRITGIQFNRKYGEKLLAYIDEVMPLIEEEIEAFLPPRRMKKGEEKDFKFPAKPWNKDGTWSANMEKWMEKHKAERIDNFTVLAYGKSMPIIANQTLDIEMKMELKDQKQLKEWLMDLGWEPTLWNIQRDARGKPVKVNGDVVKTTPKFHEQGKLCEGLEVIPEDKIKPEHLRRIIEWLSLRNRKGTLEGWLSNERLDYDGKLSAGSSGLAASHRQKHVEVVNVPKAQDDVVLGKEFRSLFTHRPGKRCVVGYDAAALEARVEGHHTNPYDGGENMRQLLSGDPHTANAFVFYPHLLKEFDKSDPSVKEDKRFKPFRAKSKNGRYALAYGCSPAKLGKTLGISEAAGKPAYDAFWEANYGLAAFRDKIKVWWETKGCKKYIPAIDGRLLHIRSAHSIVNQRFQSTGAIVMDLSGCFMDMWLGGLTVDNEGYPCYHYKGEYIYRVGYFHDEFIWDVPEHLAEEIGHMGVKSIVKAGEYLKMTVPLDGEAKWGKSWKDIH